MLLLPLFDFAQNIESVDHSNSIKVQELKDHMYYLASDELAGRLPGTKGYNIAADYAVTQFNQAGLKPICVDSSGNKNYKQMMYFRKYTVGPNDSLIVEKNGIKKVYFATGDYVCENLTAPLSETINGEVVFVGNGLYEPELNWNDYEGINLKDKWILLFWDIEPDYVEGFAETLKESGKQINDLHKSRYEFIDSSNAKGVIMILSEKYLDSWSKSEYNYSTRFKLDNINNQTGIKEGMQYITVNIDILNHIFEEERYDPINRNGKYQTYRFDNLRISLYKEYLLSKTKSPNVVAYIEGSDSILKNEFVVVGAHLDHMGIVNGNIMNGADDNASGCTTVLEVAEAIALSKPKRSVAFVLFTQEERGLLGSKHFVDNCPIELDLIQLYVNLDLIGRSDGKASGVSPEGYNLGPVNIKNLLKKVNSDSVHLNLDFAFADTSGFIKGSDHYRFYQKGIPVINFSDGLNVDSHTPDDDADKIDFDYMRNIGVLTYSLVMEVANREESLR